MGDGRAGGRPAIGDGRQAAMPPRADVDGMQFASWKVGHLKVHM